MPVRQILLWPDAALRQASEPVAQIDRGIETLSRDMLDTMYDASGRGLAAPQVGVMLRIFVMDATWKNGRSDPQVFINPQIQETSDEMISQAEGCLSIPGVMLEVSRHAQVRVAWTALSGARLTQVFDGFASACIQHELDHLNGTVTFDRVAKKARAKAEAEYKAIR